MQEDNIIQGETYRFTLITEKLIRLEYSETGVFEDAPTQTVLNRDLGKVAYHLIDEENRLEIITTHFHLYYNKAAFSKDNLFIDVLNKYSLYNNRWYYGTTPETLKGTARTLDMIDGSTELGEGIISKAGLAILDDSDSFVLDENNNPEPRKQPEEDLYFFGYGRSYLEAIQDFYKLTGKTPLLPRYALGNWWSRYWKYDEGEYLELMDRFENEKVPLSVSVIDMDWHLTDLPERFGSGWTGYTWNRELFPDPKRFLKTLHDKGLKVTLNVHPASGILAFEEQYPVVAEKLGLDPSIEEPAKFDIDNPAFRETYFEDVHHPLEKEGVDFWWIDWQQGTNTGNRGLDPLWLLNHYHYQDIQANHANGIILSRYAGPGSHRYPIGFSGDAVISWKSLAFQPYFTATASNIGYTWWSHDIGGHMQGYREDELALRWYQFGVFSPINRLHSSCSPFTGKEPWRFNPIVAEAMKDFLRLRHAFIPYLYTLNVQTHRDGIPLIMPIYYLNPDREEAYHVPNEYYFGEQLIVAPITERMDKKLQYGSTKVWLPEGSWYDFFTGRRYKGNVELEVFRSLEEYPVFAKAGAIIPLDKYPAETKGETLPLTLEWQLFAGASNRFTMVEKAGDNEAKTTVELDIEAKKVHLHVEDPAGILPKERTHLLHLKGFAALGEAVGAKRVEKEIFALESETAIFASLEPNKVQDVTAEVYRRLDKAEIAYDLKDRLYTVWQSQGDDFQIGAVLGQLQIKGLEGLLYEMLYVKNS